MMESTGTSVTLVGVTGFFLLISTAFYRWVTGPLRVLRSIGVPIADGYKPFVGHVLERGNTKHLGEFGLQSVKRYGKVFGTVQFRCPTLIVTDREMLREILTRQFDYFTDRGFLPLRGWMERSLLEERGAEWKRIRTMLTPFFSSGKMKLHVKIMQQCIHTMLENLEKICSSQSSNCFNARTIAEAYSMDVICGCGYGLNTDSQNDPDHPLISTMRRINNISLFSPKLFIAFVFPSLGRFMSACGVTMFPSGYLEFFESTVRQLVNERKKNPIEREDFLQTLVNAEEEYKNQFSDSNKNSDDSARKGLDNEALLAQALLFFLAGYDTTAGAISFLMYNLATHPHIQEKLHTEINQHLGKDELPGYENIQKLTYLDCCINESQRLFPASFIFDRVAVDDVTVLGVHIPKGTGITVPVWAIHHDPDIWPDPETFNPDRFVGGGEVGRVEEYTLLQFGAGQRACIGARFARLEVKIAITQILRKFQLKTNERTQIPLELDGEGALFVHAKDGPWLSLVHRQ